MPRARAHLALTFLTRSALQDALPDVYDVVLRHREDFLAGTIAPDALRLFAGQDKLSAHFYDDQIPATWTEVVSTICSSYPQVAYPEKLSPAQRAWMFGYLTHVLSDIAYWRHVVTQLPPLATRGDVHFGAWIIADQLPIAEDDRALDVDLIHEQAAPPWVSVKAVRQMLARVAVPVLSSTGTWAAELAYARNAPGMSELTDADILMERQPRWEQALAAAQASLPAGSWTAFREEDVSGAVASLKT